MKRQFVILRHERSEGDYHWDLLFDLGETRLKTFSLESSLVERGVANGTLSGRVSVSPDHRRVYLRFEGEISGGRGTVRRIEEGEFLATHENTVLHFQGKSLSGTLQMQDSPSVPWSVEIAFSDDSIFKHDP